MPPRVRVAFRVALLVAVLLAGVAGARALWHSHLLAKENHQRAEIVAAYKNATAAVAHVKLPAGIQREPASSCYQGDALCGRSALAPLQLLSQLRQIVGGGHLERAPGCQTTRPWCPMIAAGKLDGFHLTAIAFHHLLVVLHAKPPRGAQPVPPGRHHLFWVGSDIHVRVDLPPALQTG
jgi:hypothetical protein